MSQEVAIRSNNDILQLLADGVSNDEIAHQLVNESKDLALNQAMLQVVAVREMAVNNFKATTRQEMRALLAVCAHKTLAMAMREPSVTPRINAMKAVAELYGITDSLESDSKAKLSRSDAMAQSIQLCKDMLQQKDIIDQVLEDKAFYIMLKKRLAKSYKPPKGKKQLKVVEVESD